MLTIIGNGMGGYDFDNITLDLTKYDKILCDKNFIPNDTNILKCGYKSAKEYILKNYIKEDILYVVTGSPFYFSGGILIAKQLQKDKVKIIDNKSSKVYMQEKLFINPNDIDSVSLHGRSSVPLDKFLVNIYTFILCDIDSIIKIKNILYYLKPEDIEVTIGYKLGYKDEIITQLNIFSDDYKTFDLSYPYILVIKRLFTKEQSSSKDEQFQTQRGMITKRYKRDLSLQNLFPLLL